MKPVTLVLASLAGGVALWLGYDKLVPARLKVKVGSVAQIYASALQSSVPLIVGQQDVVSVHVAADQGASWSGTILDVNGNKLPAGAVPVSFAKSAPVISVM